MPKSKADDAVQVGQRNLVDARANGALVGFTEQYINRLAAAGKIPWHGVRNGARVYRRFDKLEVLDALKHGVECLPPAVSFLGQSKSGPNLDQIRMLAMR